MKNYRPVSNLNFVSKIIEYSKSNSFTFERNDLSNQYQSAYKKIHSTETALLKVEVRLAQTTNANGFWNYESDYDYVCRASELGSPRI